MIDLQNKHQNTLGQWNSAKEQLDVERSRIVDAFQSLKTATSFFEKGINAVHAAMSDPLVTFFYLANILVSVKAVLRATGIMVKGEKMIGNQNNARYANDVHTRS